MNISAARVHVVVGLVAFVICAPTCAQEQKQETAVPNIVDVSGIQVIDVKDFLRGSDEEFNCGELLSRHMAYHPSVASAILTGRLSKKGWFDDLSKDKQQEILKIANKAKSECDKKLGHAYQIASKARVSRQVTLFEFRKLRDEYGQIENELADHISAQLDPDQFDALAAAFVKRSFILSLPSPLIAKSLALGSKQRESMSMRYNDYVREMTHLPSTEMLPKDKDSKEYVDAMIPMRIATAKLWTIFTAEQLKRFLQMRGEMSTDDTFADYLSRQPAPFATILKEHVEVMTDLNK